MSVEQFGKDLANVVMPPDIILDQKSKIEGLWTGIATVITNNMKQDIASSRYWMVMSADKLVYDPNEDTLEPNVINITAWQQSGVETPFSPLVKWRVNGGDWTENFSKTYEISNIDKTATNIIVEISTDADHVLDSETIPILNSASDKYTIDLSNNVAMLSGNSDGVVLDYSSANTIVKVYRGAGLVDTDIVMYIPVGVSATYDGVPYISGTPVISNKTLQITGIPNSTKTANIPISLSVDPNIETTFNISKPSDGKEGIGISAIVSWITSSANLVVYNPNNNTYDKDEITFSAWYRQGAESVQPLAVQWKINDGSWSTETTSTLTVPMGVSGQSSDFTVEISIDNGEHILDSETVAILSTNSEALTIQLTNDAHVIATDKDNIAIPSSLALATTIPYVYRGATKVNEKIYIAVPDGLQITYDGSDYPSDIPIAVDPEKEIAISYLSMNLRGAIITIYTANPEISPPIQKAFVIATAPTGATGYNARSVIISTTKQAFTYDSEGNLKPTGDAAVITASTIGSPEDADTFYEFIVDGVSVQNGLEETYNYTPPSSYSNMPDVVEVKVREISVDSDIVSQDQMTFVGLKEGGNAITVLLTNEAHTLPTQNNGTVDYANSGTAIQVWEGTTPLITDNSAPYSNSSFRVVIEEGDAINVTPGSPTYNIYDVTYGNCSNLTQNIGTITFTIIITNSAGGQITLTKIQSLSKSLQGSNGVMAVATYSDLASITGIFDGMVAFTEDTKKFYIYNGTLSRWEIQRVHVDNDTISGNLADNSMWEIGTTGSQLTDNEVPALAKGYIAQYSDPIQNEIVRGIISSGLESAVWKSQYLGSHPYGRGWNTTYFSIDPNKTYRYVVFIKRTDWSVNGGYTLFGFGTNDGTTGAKRLSDGVTVNYPYFMENPTINFDPTHWYCYVGFVHASGTTLSSNQGAIYDCTTGLKVYTLIDFKWLASTTTANHRVYFSDCVNTTNNYQFMSDPRVEEVNGKETQITTLIKNSLITIIPNIYPKYIGAKSYASLPTSSNYGDLVIAYSSNANERGFYQWGFNNSWEKISAANVTTQMISQAWADICKVVNDGYGTIAEYVGNGVNFVETLGANTAFINELYTNKIEIQTNGLIRSASYEDDGDLRVGQTKGFYLNYDGTFKASDAYFSGSIYSSSGTIGNFTLDTALRYTKTAYNETTNNGIYIGSDGLGLGKGLFFVDSTGALTATSATITGAVTATSGAIGNFFIGDYLNSGSKETYNDNVAGVHLGSDGIGLGSLFKVSADGHLIASEIDVSGDITASTGSIGSFTIGTYLNTGSKATYNDDIDGVHLGSDGIGLGSTFKVSAAGALTTTSGKIANWDITSNALSTGNYATLDKMYFGSNGLSLSDKFKVSNQGFVETTKIKAHLQECVIADVTAGANIVKQDDAPIYYYFQTSLQQYPEPEWHFYSNYPANQWTYPKSLLIAASGVVRVYYSFTVHHMYSNSCDIKLQLNGSDVVGSSFTATSAGFYERTLDITLPTQGQIIVFCAQGHYTTQNTGVTNDFTINSFRISITESPGILTYLGTGGDTGITVGSPTIAVTNDQTTDATMYSLFVSGTTGIQALKTNTNFTFNPYTSVVGMTNASITTLSAGSITTTGSTVVGGDLTVNGTVTTLNSTELTVDDKNIELGFVTTPTDTTANGGGIILKGATDKSILWSNTESDWISNQGFSVVKTNVGGRGGEINIVNNAGVATGNSAALNFGLESSTYTGDSGNAQIKAILNGNTGASTDLVFSLWDGDSFDEVGRFKSNGKLGLKVVTPSYDISLNGDASKQIGLERNTIAGTAGNYLQIISGGATSGATNKNGGDLYLKSGVSTGTGTSNIYFDTATAGTTGTADRTPTTKMTILGSGKIGIGTTTPSYILSFNGNSSQQMWMERHTTADTAGNSLTIQSGGATSGATNKNGGDLVLQSGISTGTGSSNISFNTVIAGTTGTADRTPTTKMYIAGSGYVGINTTTPSSTLNIVSLIPTATAFYNRGILVENYGAEAYSGKGLNILVAQGTKASPTTVTTSAAVPLTDIYYYDGSKYRMGSRLYSYVSAVVANTSVASGLIFQTGVVTGDATNGANTGLTEQMRLDSSGNLLVGTNTLRANYYIGASSVTPKVQLEAISTDSSLSITRNSADQGSPRLFFGKSRGTTVGAVTVVQANDQLGEIVFTGADGTNLRTAAGIAAFCDSTPGSADMPGRLVFYTTADGSAIYTERMNILSTGNIGVNTSSPQAKFDIAISEANTTFGAVYHNLRLVNTDATNNNWMGITAASSAGSSYHAGIGFQITSHTTSAESSEIAFFTRNAGDFSEKVRITSDGKMGIGTTSPTSKLDVENTRADNTYDSIAEFSSLGSLGGGTRIAITSSGATSYIEVNSNAYNIGVRTNTNKGDLNFVNTITGGTTGAINFFVNDTNALTIKPTGKIGINKYSDVNAYLDVAIPDDDRVLGLSIAQTNQAIYSVEGQRANMDLGSAKGILTYVNTGALGLRIGNSGNAQVLLNSTGKLGIGTVAPTNILSLGGNSAQTIWMERPTTAETAGNNLTVQAGGAIANSTNKVGGDLYLQSGIATGTGSSNIYFATTTAGTSGLVDRLPSTKMTILGSGDVGIGTTAPVHKLDVRGNVAIATYVLGGGKDYGASGSANNTTLKLYDSSTGNTTLNNIGYNIDIQTASTSRIFINQTGYVGIATSSPTKSLSFTGNSEQTIWMERNTIANTVGKSLYIQAGGATTSATNKNGGDLYLRSGISTGTGYSNIYFDTVSAGVTGTVDNSLTTKMVITGVGNVGVGTVSPVEKIHVEGNIRVDDASGNDGFKISYNNSSKTLDFIFVGV